MDKESLPKFIRLENVVGFNKVRLYMKAVWIYDWMDIHDDKFL